MPANPATAEEWTVYYQYRTEPRVIYKEKLTRLEAVAVIEDMRKSTLEGFVRITPAELPNPFYAERSTDSPVTDTRKTRNIKRIKAKV